MNKQQTKFYKNEGNELKLIKTWIKVINVISSQKAFVSVYEWAEKCHYNNYQNAIVQNPCW